MNLEGEGGAMNPKEEPRYKDPTAPIGVRVEDLIARMTREEKVSQMVHDAAASP